MEQQHVVRIAAQGADVLPYSDLTFFQGDLKSLSKENYEKLKMRIIEDGFSEPISVWQHEGHNYILNGHQRYRTIKTMVENEGWECPELPVSYIQADSMAQAKRKVLSLTSQFGELEKQGLYQFMHEAEIPPGELEAFPMPEIDVPKFKAEFFDTPQGGDSEEGEKYGDGEKGSMIKNFLVPPFSVLDSKQEYWQQRKRAWHEMGINSHEGRDIDNTSASEEINRGSDEGGSIFDPFLAQVLYSWFCPSGGYILDPFAGGSVRGIVASKLGYNYTGVDIRPEQVEENLAQAQVLVAAGDGKVNWHTGDSRQTVPKLVENFDMIFSCPPYGDLEVYSDDPNDISNMQHDDFIQSYRDIIRFSCSKLRNNSFACFVVGEYRDAQGNYNNFVGETIEAFRDAGLTFYNEAVYLTPLGSLPLRAGRQFKAGRKFGKAHQNVLVFCKGSPQLAVDRLPEFADGSNDSGESQ